MGIAAATIEVFGKTGGLAGLSLAVVLIVFRDIIARKIFPQLEKKDAYRLLRLVALLSTLICILGMILWANPMLIIGHGNIVSSVNGAQSSQKQEEIRK